MLYRIIGSIVVLILVGAMVYFSNDPSAAPQDGTTAAPATQSNDPAAQQRSFNF